MRVVEVELEHDVLVVGAGVPMKSEHTHTHITRDEKIFSC